LTHIFYREFLGSVGHGHHVSGTVVDSESVWLEEFQVIKHMMGSTGVSEDKVVVKMPSIQRACILYGANLWA
jgi:hypothetical protein